MWILEEIEKLELYSINHTNIVSFHFQNKINYILLFIDAYY